MKKFMFIVICVMSISHAYAEDCANDCVGLSLELEAFVHQVRDNTVVATDLQVWYKYSLPFNIMLSPYGGVKTWMLQGSDFYRGNPFRDTYTIGGQLKWGGLYVDFMHFCEHSVSSTDEAWELNKRYITVNSYKYCYIQATELTTLSAGYVFELYNFDIKVNISKAIENPDFYYNGKVDFEFSLWSITSHTYFDYGVWTGNRRDVCKMGETLTWKGITLGIEYYYSSREIELFEGNHTYDENPLETKAVFATIKYKFN